MAQNSISIVLSPISFYHYVTINTSMYPSKTGCVNEWKDNKTGSLKHMHTSCPSFLPKSSFGILDLVETQ